MNIKINEIDIEAAALAGNKIWFCLADYKSLVSMDMDSKEKKTFLIPSGGSYIQNMAFRCIKLVGRKLYLIPFHERVIMQFDIDTEEFRKIEIEERFLLHGEALFRAVAVFQNNIFIMGTLVPVIVRLNTVDNQIDYITEWKTKEEALIFDGTDPYFTSQCVVVDTKLFAPFANANAVLELDCVSLETVIHSIGEEKQGYGGICFDGDSFWLAPRKHNNLMQWNRHTKQVRKLQITGARVEWGVGMVSYQNKKMLFATLHNPEAYQVEEDMLVLSGRYRFVQEDEKYIVYCTWDDGILTVIDKEWDTQSVIDVKEELDGSQMDIGRMMNEQGNVIEETAKVTIQHFIDSL